jgi:hypothetical protein
LSFLFGELIPLCDDETERDDPERCCTCCAPEERRRGLSRENGLGGWIELCLAMAWRDGTRRFKEKKGRAGRVWALVNIEERSAIPETIFMKMSFGSINEMKTPFVTVCRVGVQSQTSVGGRRMGK